LRGKIPPFYISIENHDVALHNCLVDTSATNNYETGESIYAIDSRQVPTYAEIKEFYAWIMTTPHIITVFNIIVVELIIYGYHDVATHLFQLAQNSFSDNFGNLLFLAVLTSFGAILRA
jgi:hypothetical protein